MERAFRKQMLHSLAKSLRQNYGYRGRNIIFRMPITPTASCNQFTLNADQFCAYILDLKMKDKILVRTEVITGLPIDLFFVNEQNFKLYRDGKDFTFFKDFSALDTRDSRLKVTAICDGRFYYIIDNTSHPAGKASPDRKYKGGKAEISVTIDCLPETKSRIRPFEA